MKTALIILTLAVAFESAVLISLIALRDHSFSNIDYISRPLVTEWEG